MALLQEIIGEATSRDGDVPRMLRLCLTLAKRLSHEPLAQWARSELEGYSLDAELPSYRHFGCRNRGVFENSAKRVTLDLILSVLPEAHQAYYQKVDMLDGVGELTDLLARVTAKGEGALQIPWPTELAMEFGSRMSPNAQCIKAWREISAAELAGMIDQIKTRVLEFALDIESESPLAGNIPGTDVSVKADRVTQIFNTTIAGGVQNLANGSTHVVQTAQTDIIHGDLDGLLRLLRANGLPEADIDALSGAIDSDRTASPDHSMGAAVKHWLGDMSMRAATGAIELGLDKLTGIVLPAIMDYLGAR